MPEDKGKYRQYSNNLFLIVPEHKVINISKRHYNIEKYDIIFEILHKVIHTTKLSYPMNAKLNYSRTMRLFKRAMLKQNQK